MTNYRLASGLAIAWCAVVALAICSGPLYLLATDIDAKAHALPTLGPWDWSVLQLFVMVGVGASMIAAPVAAAVAFLFGWPVFGCLFRRGARTIISYLGAGLLLSIAVMGLIFFAQRYWEFLDTDFVFISLLVGVSGPVAGASFWLKAVRREPSI